VAEFVVIPARFNGPPASGNGGYTCGAVASLLESEVAQVSLRTPPPLGRPLSVSREDGRVEIHDAETIVAEGEASELLLDVPDPVDPDAAAAASRAGFERWAGHHPFPTCVICGPERESGDGFRIFPGPLSEADGTFAADWTPEAGLAGADGLVRTECVWGALDCPTSAPVAEFGAGPPVVLARLTARLGCPVRAGERHSIVSWPIAVEGRKRHSAAALFDARGRLLCAAQALWIELREEPAP
jgi:hypothetical protein